MAHKKDTAISEHHFTTMIKEDSVKKFKKDLANLTKQGFDVDTLGNEDRSPLAIASGCGRYDIVKLLLKNGAKIDMQKVKGGKTALMSACRAGHHEVAELLLNNGAKLDTQNKDGWSALMFASHGGHTDVVKLLLDKGADTDLQSEQWESALSLALLEGHSEVISILEEKAEAPEEGPPTAEDNASEARQLTKVAEARLPKTSWLRRVFGGRKKLPRHDEPKLDIGSPHPGPYQWPQLMRQNSVPYSDGSVEDAEDAELCSQSSYHGSDTWQAALVGEFRRCALAGVSGTAPNIQPAPPPPPPLDPRSSTAGHYENIQPAPLPPLDPMSSGLSSTHSASVVLRPESPYTAIPLSINTLTLLKWKDQHGCMKKFKLITKVSSKWRDFGIRLSHELDQLEAWAEEYRGVSSRCWCRVMNYWITENDSPDYPATWSGLFLVLEDVEYSEVAAELKKALASVMPTNSKSNAKSRRLLPLSIYAPFKDTNRGSVIKESLSRSYKSPPAPPSPPVSSASPDCAFDAPAEVDHEKTVTAKKRRDLVRLNLPCEPCDFSKPLRMRSKSLDMSELRDLLHVKVFCYEVGSVMKDRKEKMEALVELRKLKEERRNLQNALQVLMMFAFPGNTSDHLQEQ